MKWFQWLKGHVSGITHRLTTRPKPVAKPFDHYTLKNPWIDFKYGHESAIDKPINCSATFRVPSLLAEVSDVKRLKRLAVKAKVMHPFADAVLFRKSRGVNFRISPDSTLDYASKVHDDIYTPLTRNQYKALWDTVKRSAKPIRNLKVRKTGKKEPFPESPQARVYHVAKMQSSRDLTGFSVSANEANKATETAPIIRMKSAVNAPDETITPKVATRDVGQARVNIPASKSLLAKISLN